MKTYDNIILQHYKGVAEASGLSANATMADNRTRDLETVLIQRFFTRAVAALVASGRRPEEIVVADMGCGNGYTLSSLRAVNGAPRFIGYEYSPDMRQLACDRFGGDIEIRPVDIRDRKSFGDEPIDILLCQRVLINLLDPADQIAARDNLIQLMRVGGHMLFIESFDSNLALLNQARAEFELEPIPPAHHNLYMGDDFFAAPGVAPWTDVSDDVHEHFLSSHYFVTRVLHPIMLGTRPFQHNSLFTQFMSQAIPQNVGEFSPIRAIALTRIG